MFWKRILNLILGKRKSNNQEDESSSPETVHDDGSKTQLAPGTHISYDRNLIGLLIEDHKNLIALYHEIGQSFKNNNLIATTESLNSFGSVLQSHLLTENVRLYIYLEHMFEDHPANHTLIHDFHYEMDGIGKAAIGFLNKYRQLADNPELVSTFSADFEYIGKVLTNRIEREETFLYQLYQSASQIKEGNITLDSI